jgi:S-adenosylmethionine:tRNA ribosyltransferase-isomerase
LTRSDFSFDLPPELIAQEPPPTRGESRLLLLNRSTGSLSDHRFGDLPALLRPGDLLVVNDTRVFPARLLGRRLPGGGAAECLLVRRLDPADQNESTAEVWEALVHPGQRLKEGSRLEFEHQSHRLHGEIVARRFHGRRSVRLWTDGPSVREVVDRIGHMPLPPYIKRGDTLDDRERYQTVYAGARGSVAAPTAGLHFTLELLDALDARGVERAAVTLHVGYGTFQPIRVDRLEEHQMASEQYDVSAEAANAINAARASGRRVIAVGTTTTRTLESVPVDAEGHVTAGRGSTDLFITPGHRFRVVDGLITNFHLPESSLIVLVSAFAGRDQVLDSYRHAVAHRYRFYSYGDANLIL